MSDRIHAISFPFDLFGNAGCGAGAQLLCDVIREIIADTKQEKRSTRADAYHGKIDVTEFEFDTPKAVAEWHAIGSRAIKKSLKDHRFTLWLGGNHLSVLPVYEALNEQDLVIQFDAHLDIFDLHDTTEHLSHGNFLKHAESLPKIINMGHRDLLIRDQPIQKIFTMVNPAWDLAEDHDAIFEEIDQAKRIWIDIDVDVFDPAFCPAVHQRTPFGMAPLAVLNVLDSIWCEKMVGFSISEFDPGRDRDDQSLNLLGWLVEWVLLKVSES